MLLRLARARSPSYGIFNHVVVGKVRRVEDAELHDTARLARDCAVMTQAVALSRWISDTGPRPVTPRQVLSKPDLPSAAEAIGVSLPTRLRTAADIPALNRPWCLALATGLLRVDDGTVSVGLELARWPPADAEVLSAWLAGLSASCAAEAGLGPDEHEEAVGDALALLGVLQVARVPAGPALVQAVRAAARDLYDEFGLDTSFSWAADERLLTKTAARLASFGAVNGNDVLAGGCVITPLGRWAADRLRAALTGLGKDLTAAELIAYLANCVEDDRDEQAWDWLDAQSDPADAARQLLQAGSSLEPRLRWIAADMVELLGEDALPAWREMTEVSGIGPHARYALYQMDAGPEPIDAEWLWLAVESAAVALAEKGPDEAVSALWESLPGDQLPTDDLDHRLAAVHASDHPSARSLAQEIADYVASAGTASLERAPVPTAQGHAQGLAPADLANRAAPGHRQPVHPAPGGPDSVRVGRRPPARVPGSAGDLQRPVLRAGRCSERVSHGGAARPRRRRREDRLRVRLRRWLDARDRPAEEAAAGSRRRLPGVREVERRLAGRVPGRGTLVRR